MKALIITAPGINCDLELLRAFEQAGASAELVVLRSLMRRPALLDRADLIGLPGGFSYGDDIAAGRIMAQLIRHSIRSALVAALERGVPMICPCNGFQIAVQAGLLPETGTIDRPPVPRVSLAVNQDARFHDRWTRVEIPRQTRCIWTRGLEAHAEPLLPSAHGEGRFVASDATIAELAGNAQVAIRYAEDANFNGSMDRIAGICDPTGLILGLMPHPERFTRWTQHPWWTRLDPATRAGVPLGLAIFRNAIAWVREHRARDGGAGVAPSAAPQHTVLDRGHAP